MYFYKFAPREPLERLEASHGKAGKVVVRMT
jgi:hypothetical protein